MDLSNIDLLSKSIVFNEWFKYIHELYDAYELFLELKDKEECEQEPFKLLLKKYKVEENFKFIPAATIKYKIEKGWNDNISFKPKFWEDYFPGYSNSSNCFFCGFKKEFDILWYVYYEVEDEIFIYVLKKDNERFLKSYFVQTSSSALDNKFVKEKLDYYKEEIKDSGVATEEYFCVDEEIAFNGFN